MSFTAVPYFASAVSSGDVGLQYEWRVNQSPITTSPTHGNEITVNAASSTGLMALINLSLTHVSNYFLSAAGSWSVTFNKSGGPAGGDVFHQSRMPSSPLKKRYLGYPMLEIFLR